MTRHHTAAIAATAVLALGLTACGHATPSEPQTPTVINTPTLIYLDGIEPNSPLENDPLVKIARESDIGQALAQNTGDFTIAQLTETTSSKGIADAVHLYATFGAMVFPGPATLWQPVKRLSMTRTDAWLQVCWITSWADTPWEKRINTRVVSTIGSAAS